MSANDKNDDKDTQMIIRLFLLCFVSISIAAAPNISIVSRFPKLHRI